MTIQSLNPHLNLKKNASGRLARPEVGGEL
jgi:hypothetical protein